MVRPRAELREGAGPRKQRWLAKCIKETGHTEDFDALIAHGGIKLMGVACSPASILITKMAEKFGEDAVRRVSAWNGHKLGAPAGDQKAREARDDAEPDHLWVSMRCGPLSNLTLGFNGTKPLRTEATKKRRYQAIKEYKSAVQLVYDQVAQGKHAHWEWPIKCEGWGRAMIRQMVEDFDDDSQGRGVPARSEERERSATTKGMADRHDVTEDGGQDVSGMPWRP